MAAKLKIGSGLRRARKNRSRGPRVKPAAKLAPAVSVKPTIAGGGL